MSFFNKAKKEKPSSISLLIDIDVGSKMVESIPSGLLVLVPSIKSDMEEATKTGKRFFGIVVAPGEKVESYTGTSAHFSFVDDLIGDMCRFANKFGNLSQWMITSDAKTKDVLMKRVDEISIAVVKQEKELANGESN